MTKRKVRSSKKTVRSAKRCISKNSCCFGLDKLIWGLVAFLALAYMVIMIAPQVSAR